MTTILVVDDDSFLLDWYRHVLTPAGYQIVTCGSPEEARASLATSRPDLVITDLMMSELDSGFELVRHVRGSAQLKHIPVIVITAIKGRFGLSFTPRNDDELRPTGADAFFEKPVAPERLLKTIRQLLRPTAGR